MRFCHNCGKELDPELNFCKHCGQKIENKEGTAQVGESQTDPQPKPKTEPETKPQTEQQSSDQIAQPKRSQPLSTKTKLLIALVGAFAIILIVGYQVGSSFTSYERLIDKLEEALIEEDAQAVAKVISTNTPNLTIDEHSVTGFMDYYKERPSEIHILIESLRASGTNYDHVGEFSLETDHVGTIPVTLEEDGKRLLFFTGYKMIVPPVYFNVFTNYESTAIYLNDEKIAEATSDSYWKEVGPYLSGVYTFKAVYETEFIDLETERQFTNIYSDYPEEVDLYLHGDNVTFDLPFSPDALASIDLYVNGENAGINLFEQNTIGPVLIDESMTVAFEAEFPWGKMKTSDIPIYSEYMDAFILPDESLKEKAKAAIIQFNEDYMEAYTKADVSLLTNTTEDVDTTVERKYEYDEWWGDNYQGKFVGIDFYNEAYSLSYSDGTWKLSVGTNTLHEETRFSNYSEPDLSLSESDTNYELIYDEANDKWLVNNYDHYGYFTKETVDEYRADEPELYTAVWAEEYFERIEEAEDESESVDEDEEEQE